jgi:hypothetical protein
MHRQRSGSRRQIDAPPHRAAFRTEKMMQARLKNLYYALLAPLVAGFAMAAASRRLLTLPSIPDRVMAAVAPGLFLAAALLAVAGPVLIRTLFAHRHGASRGVSPGALYAFERRLIVIPMAAPYLALVAYCLQLPHFFLAATVLMALIAIYHACPTTARSSLDLRIYRVPRSVSDDGTAIR